MKKLLAALALLTVGCYSATSQQVDVTEDSSTATPIEVKPYVKWTCPTCSPNEQYVLKQLQLQANIYDKNSLATIMGNIKQESKFIPNICEGGARVEYNQCHRGGYGLIQWTTEARYLGLGLFAKKYGCNPSTLECQTRYMINENQFQKVLPDFLASGFPVKQYMVPAYYWLGWGVEGPRLNYSYDYTKSFISNDQATTQQTVQREEN